MDQGLRVDTFTSALLRIAQEPQEGSELNDTLRTYFHDARNRLSVIKVGLHLGRRGWQAERVRLWEELEASYRSVEQLIEHVQLLCRPLPFEPCRSSLSVWMGERLHTWVEWFDLNRRTLETRKPKQEQTGYFDPTQLLNGIDALIHWRSTAGAPGDPARLSWDCVGDRYEVEWREPHVESGVLLDARNGQGMSVALPLLSRVMKVHGGTLEVSMSEGLHVKLRWPIGADV